MSQSRHPEAAAHPEAAVQNAREGKTGDTFTLASHATSMVSAAAIGMSLAATKKKRSGRNKKQ